MILFVNLRLISPALAFVLVIAAATLVGGGARAQDLPMGKTSHLPLPRFVSIKASPVNVRQGPSLEQDIAWKFLKASVPVEVTQEYDIWFRIRDSDGQEGWVQKTLLSGRRTALVTPWVKGPPIALYDKAGSTTKIAMLERRVLVDVSACDGRWCRIAVEGTKGWLEQEKLWGVYPGEKFE